MPAHYILAGLAGILPEASALLSAWLATFSPRTRKLYARELQRFAQFAEHVDVSALLAVEYLAAERERGLSQSTLCWKRRVLASFIEHIAKEAKEKP